MLESFNESLVIALEESLVESWENHRKNKESGENNKPTQKKRRRPNMVNKKEEVEKAKPFLSYFGKDQFRINHKNKEWYVKFSLHAMARYVERDAKMDKKWLEELLVKMIKVLQFKEKNKLFLVYSVSLKRAMVVSKKTDDSFNVVTVYPEGENVQSKNTQKVLIENLYYGVIDEYIEIE